MVNFALYIPLIAYVIFLAYVVLDVNLGQEVRTADQYALGERSYTWFIVFMSLAASMIGPTYSIGVVEEANTESWFYTLFFILSALQLLIVGTFFAAPIKIESEGKRTVGDIVGYYYDDSAQFLTGIATVAQALAFTGTLCFGAGDIMEGVWGIPFDYGVIGTALLVGLYASVAGMPAVLRTDEVQFGFLVAILILGIISGAFLWSGSTVEPEWAWNINPETLPPSTIMSTAVAFLLGEAFLPIYTVRGFLADTGKTATSGFQVTATFGILWFAVLGWLGVLAHLLPQTYTSYGVTLLNVVSYISSVDWVSALAVGVVVTGILGIVMSTLDSVLNVGGVSFIRDISSTFLDISDDEERTYDPYAVIIIAVFGSSFALYSDTLVDILLIGYTVWVPTVVFPIGYCLIADSVSWRGSATASIIGGVIGFVVGKMLSFAFLPPILLGFILNIAFFYLSNWIMGEKKSV